MSYYQEDYIGNLLRENAELRANNAELRASKNVLSAWIVELLPYTYNPAVGPLRQSKTYLGAARVLAETPIQSLEAISAEAKEACAKLVEGYCDCVSDLPCDYCGELHEIATAIRARGDGGEATA